MQESETGDNNNNDERHGYVSIHQTIETQNEEIKDNEGFKKPYSKLHQRMLVKKGYTAMNQNLNSMPIKNHGSPLGVRFFSPLLMRNQSSNGQSPSNSQIGSANGSFGFTKEPIVCKPFIPINACKQELSIHAFLNSKDIFNIDIKSMIEQEGRVQCISPRLQDELNKQRKPLNAISTGMKFSLLAKRQQNKLAGVETNLTGATSLKACASNQQPGSTSVIPSSLSIQKHQQNIDIAQIQPSKFQQQNIINNTQSNLKKESTKLLMNTLRQNLQKESSKNLNLENKNKVIKTGNSQKHMLDNFIDKSSDSQSP